MLKDFTNDLYENMMAEIEQQMENNNYQNTHHKSATLTAQKYMALLNELIDEQGFKDDQEEIWYFKSEKPRFHSWLIFYNELFNLGNAKPRLLRKDRDKYYKEYVAYINRFFNTNEFLYQYYRIGGEELDQLYFLRSAPKQGILMSHVPMIESNYGTGHEYFFSRFKAYEMLLTHLEDLTTENKVLGGDELTKSRDTAPLRWTGELLNLIELIYALHSAGQIDEGRASLVQLKKTFENIFGVNLDNYSRRFSDIKNRKGMSKTRFIDELREGLMEKISDADAFIPK